MILRYIYSTKHISFTSLNIVLVLYIYIYIYTYIIILSHYWYHTKCDLLWSMILVSHGHIPYSVPQRLWLAHVYFLTSRTPQALLVIGCSTFHLVPPPNSPASCSWRLLGITQILHAWCLCVRYKNKLSECIHEAIAHEYRAHGARDQGLWLRPKQK